MKKNFSFKSGEVEEKLEERHVTEVGMGWDECFME